MTYRTEAKASVGSPSKHSHQHGSLDYDTIENLRWENEGGADPHRSDPRARHDGRDLMATEPDTHLKAVETLLENDRIDEAVTAISSAAHRLMADKDHVHALMDETIDRLTTVGCHATSPHPQALSLIRLRKQLPN